MAGFPVATETSEDDAGRTVTADYDTKLNVSGQPVAVLNSTLTGGPGTAHLTGNLSSKLVVDGKHVGKIGSTTDHGSTIITGKPKLVIP